MSTVETSREVAVETGEDGVLLPGELRIPHGARGLVVFAHGSGSSRHSPRNRHVASGLRSDGFATLLIDLLTPAEEAFDARNGALRFDIGLLTDRVVGIVDWATDNGDTAHLDIGLFGASTGAAAALGAAARRPHAVRAVVSRGGRPDLATEHLPAVRAPTLLIVGGEDTDVLELNRAAMRRHGGVCELRVVPGATHLFEERGTLDEVVMMAAGWFELHLGVSLTGRRPAPSARD